MPAIDAQNARAGTTSKELPEAYPGLEPDYLPSERLFKLKGQDPLLRGDSSTGNIRAVPGAAAATEISVYNMAQQEMTFHDAPLNAVSIAPRHRLGLTASSLQPEDSSVDPTGLADPAASFSHTCIVFSMFHARMHALQWYSQSHNLHMHMTRQHLVNITMPEHLRVC